MAGKKVYVHMLLCDEAVLVEGKKGGGSVQEIEFRLLSFDQYEDLRKKLFESKDINGALKKLQAAKESVKVTNLPHHCSAYPSMTSSWT